MLDVSHPHANDVLAHWRYTSAFFESVCSPPWWPGEMASGTTHTHSTVHCPAGYYSGSLLSGLGAAQLFSRSLRGRDEWLTVPLTTHLSRPERLEV